MAKKVKFGRKKKTGNKKGGSTDFNFGANVRSDKKRRGGFGGSS